MGSCDKNCQCGSQESVKEVSWVHDISFCARIRKNRKIIAETLIRNKLGDAVLVSLKPWN